MNPQVVGWQLARARELAGLKQAEVAARMGTTQSAVSRLESGKYSQSFDAIERYARAVGSPITLTFGADARLGSRKERRARVRAILGDFRFDPWDRDPTPAEQRTLISDGLSRERKG
jgi:transcriptional regulator with XRE-family HTH domain